MSYGFFKSPNFFNYLSFINKQGKRTRYTASHLLVFEHIGELGSQGCFYKSSHTSAYELGISRSHFIKTRDELCLPAVELETPLVEKERGRDDRGREQIILKVNVNESWDAYHLQVFGESGKEYRNSWLSVFSKKKIRQSSPNCNSKKHLPVLTKDTSFSPAPESFTETSRVLSEDGYVSAQRTQERLKTKKINKEIITTTKPYSSSAREGHTLAQNEVVVFSILNKKEFTSLDASQKAKICSSFSEEVVTKAVGYVLSRGSNVKNLGAYLYKACQGGWEVTESQAMESIGVKQHSDVVAIADRMAVVIPSGNRHTCKKMYSPKHGDYLEVKLDGWAKCENYIFSSSDCKDQLIGALSAAGLTIETLFSSKGFEIIKDHTAKVCVDYGKLKSALFNSLRVDDNYSRV